MAEQEGSREVIRDLNLARGKQNDQGKYECEVWTTVAEGEAEWNKCKKYPGHAQFIPAKQFSIQDLPEPYQDDETFEYVRLLCERTVRLLVKYTSENRPDGYPFFNFKGQPIHHSGSGMVYCYTYPERFDNEECDECSDDEDVSESDEVNDVHDEVNDVHDAVNDVRDDCVKGQEVANESDDCDDEKGDRFYEYFDHKLQPCPCQDCAHSGESRYDWGNVYILTAKHVVYDKLEAEVTVAELNFEDKHDKQSVRKLSVVDILHKDMNKGDWTTLNCVTHDRELFGKLYKTTKRFTELRDIINEKYWESPSRLALVVSHPHGWVKKVTVGEWTERKVNESSIDGEELVNYMYNTATCRGSSGAPVLVLGMRGSDPSYKTWLSQHHVHCGSLRSSNINFSGREVERKIDFDNGDEGCEDEGCHDEGCQATLTAGNE